MKKKTNFLAKIVFFCPECGILMSSTTMQLKNFSAAALIFLITLPQSMAAEGKPADSSQAGHPKVALVLSGGAALGFAHVGFLKVLEEVGIPVDIIIGNSMGSLIGALYASGYSPADIENLAKEINWAEIFLSQDVDHSEGLIDERAPILTWAFDETGSGDLRGILPDRQITFLLSKVLYRVSMRENFSELPVPFKTLAVDIAQGNIAVFEKGALYRAARASMSIPVVFPPVPLAGTFMVDGGILNNNPVDIAAAWGADIILDIDVAGFFPPEALQKVNTLDGIVDQTMRLIQSHSSARDQAGVTPHYALSMALQGYSWMDFARAQELIDLGESLARSAGSMRQLWEIALQIEQMRPLEKRDSRRQGSYFDLPEPVFQGVRLESISTNGVYEEQDKVDEEFPHSYLDRLFRRFYGTHFDFSELETAIEILQRRGRYDNVGYHLEEGPEGFTLVLTGVRAYARKHEAAISLSMDYGLGSRSKLGLTAYAELKFRDLLGRGTLLDLGASYDFSDIQGPMFQAGYSMNFLRWLSLGAEINWSYLTSSVNSFNSDSELSTINAINIIARLSFEPADFFDIALSYRYAPLWYEDKSALVRRMSGDYSGDLHLAGLELTFNTMNVTEPLLAGFFYNMFWNVKVEFPFAGSRLYSGNAFPWYEGLEAQWRKVWVPAVSRNFITDVRFSSYMGELETRWTLFSPEGKYGIPGYNGGEIYTRHKFLLGLTYLEEILPLSRLLGMRTFFAMTVRGGSFWDEIGSMTDFSNWQGGARTGLQLETPFGSLFTGLEVSFEGNVQFCLYFN
jgi:predicted acylesterase/phospholipase RssA